MRVAAEVKEDAARYGLATTASKTLEQSEELQKKTDDLLEGVFG